MERKPETQYWWIQYGGEVTLARLKFNENGFLEEAWRIGEDYPVTGVFLIQKVEKPSDEIIKNAVSDHGRNFRD